MAARWLTITMIVIFALVILYIFLGTRVGACTEDIRILCAPDDPEELWIGPSNCWGLPLIPFDDADSRLRQGYYECEVTEEQLQAYYAKRTQ